MPSTPPSSFFAASPSNTKSRTLSSIWPASPEGTFHLNWRSMRASTAGPSRSNQARSGVFSSPGTGSTAAARSRNRSPSSAWRVMSRRNSRPDFQPMPYSIWNSAPTCCDVRCMRWNSRGIFLFSTSAKAMTPQSFDLSSLSHSPSVP